MVLTRLAVACLLLALGTSAAAAADLTTIDRTTRKEPAYQSKEPLYCLLGLRPGGANARLAGPRRQGALPEPQRQRGPHGGGRTARRVPCQVAIRARQPHGRVPLVRPKNPCNPPRRVRPSTAGELDSAWGQPVPCVAVGAYPGAAGAAPWPTRQWRFVPVMQPGPRGGDLVFGDSQPQPALR
jgi:hypothetical protein